MKSCNECSVEKSLVEFPKNPGRRDGRGSTCKLCISVREKSRKSRNVETGLPVGDSRHGYNGYQNFNCRCSTCRDGLFLASIKKNHNVTVDWYAEKLIEQGFACAICAMRGVSLFIDHDHKCCPTSGKSCGTCARGLLCHHCNSGIGLFRDESIRLRAAIQYLDVAA